MSSSQVVLARSDLGNLVTLSVELGMTLGSPTLVESRHPVESLTQRPIGADAAIVFLTGTENVSDLLTLFKANRNAAFLLLTPAMPPHAAVARVVNEHHGAIVSAKESPIVVIATLIALLSRRHALAV
jgi:hypothetical protein